jgi:protein TonB
MAKSNGLLSVNDSTAPADVPPPPPPPPPAPYKGEVFLVVENSAEFQNGDINNFRIWVQQNIQYPAEAKEQKLVGKVIAQFIIAPNGNLVDIQIVRGVNPLLDNEVIRVLLKSPIWKPAKQTGKAVAQQFIIPIEFK